METRMADPDLDTIPSKAAHDRRRMALAIVLLASSGAASFLFATSIQERADEIPWQLVETGLYSDIATHTVAADVLPFEPQYPLWSDGGSKRRWIRIPPGTTIDACDPDRFVFPAGTQFWKEFSFDRRVETRMLQLEPEGRWTYATYVWSADERAATLAPDAGIPAACEAAPGVPFDIPGRADCRACHEAGASPVLGFNALQLSADRDPLAPHAAPLPAGALDLDDFVRRGLVRNLPRRLLDAPPRIEAATPRERAALGYLSTNCGICHSKAGALAGLDLDLAYSVGDSGGSRARATTVDHASRFRWATDHAPVRISASAAGLGVLPRRMASRHPLTQMPPLGTRLPDAAALDLVTGWIRDDLDRTRPVDSDRE
jgi:hypothetical protein